jgi:membrane fusion protein, copper/silver efflux system
MNRFHMLLLATGIVIVAGCKTETASGGGASGSSSGKAAHKAWHCPMHPQIVQDHAGNCPICGMDLVVIESPDATRTDANPSDTGKVVKVDPSVLQKIGVRTEIVDAGSLGREVRTDAEGVLDEASEISVTVRSMGYLETVGGSRAGDKIRKGQILATFYSPDLVAAQGDWIASRLAGDSASAAAAMERLVSLGFPSSAFDVVFRDKKPLHAIALTSPVDGWLRLRSATKGQAAMAGTELFRLVDGKGALLEARLSVEDASRIRIGDEAEITGSGTDKSISAKVVSVVPQVDRASRTATLRLAPTKGSEIRVGALYQARFQTKLETGFVIPQSAVLHSGKRDVVFVDLGGGRFKPVEVALGVTSNGKSLVRSGIEAGDEVVVSAQFLLDGESRLQAALDQLTASAEASPHGAH